MNKNYEYLSDEHANYIKILLKSGRDKDPNYEIFGSKVHQYELNETVSLEWVRAFEKKISSQTSARVCVFITKNRKWWCRSLLWNRPSKFG